jgi:hypothetical protein
VALPSVLAIAEKNNLLVYLPADDETRWPLSSDHHEKASADEVDQFFKDNDDLQEFEKLMCFEDVTSYKNNKRVFDLLNIFEVKNKKEPVFRKTLIEKVLEIVYARSRQEYAAVGRLSENSKGQITGTEASEALANAINDTSAQILKNYKMLIKAHPDLEKLCVKWYLPDVVFTEKSIEEVMKRLPYEEKIKPIVATVLASQFHYKHGISQNSAYEMFGFINALASKKITLPTIKDILKAPIQTLING